MNILRLLVVIIAALLALSYRSPQRLLFGPAFCAVEENDVDGVRRALARGLDVNTTEGGLTLLMFAASRGRADVARALIDSGARVELVSTAGATALDFASLTGDAETIAVLVRAGTDPNAANACGETPLMYAVGSGDLGKVITLLEAGADATRKNGRGRDALQLATDIGRQQIAAILINARDGGR